MSNFRKSLNSNLKDEIRKSTAKNLRPTIFSEDELERRKHKNICRFRGFVRRVIDHLYWLKQSEGDEDIYPKNLQQEVIDALKEISKTKGFLTTYDKSMLFKPPEWRTDEEKEHLYSIMCSLNCFSNYPSTAKRALAAVARITHLGPGRVVMRQGQHGLALYFVASGELVVSQFAYDPMAKCWAEMTIGMRRPGDTFGEMALMLDIPRTANCVTITYSELIYVEKEDFVAVLKSIMEKKWHLVEKAMSRFTYFSTFDEVAIREGCMLAKMKTFKPTETILGDGVGFPNFVYFVLSGQCQLIETLLISTVNKKGKQFPKIFVPKPAHESKDINGSKLPVENTSKTKVEKKVKTSEEAGEGLEKEPESNSSQTKMLQECVVGSDIFLKANDTSKKSITSSLEEDISNNSQQSSREHTSCFENLPKNVTVHFMQVCFMNAGGSFNFGEPMNNRRMVAVGNVECLLLPKYWLWKRNTGNIWSKIEHFLSRKIPSTEKVFQEYLLNKKWSDFKSRLVGDIVSDKKASSRTTVHDVPYSVRIQESTHF